ncbi:MAG: penicillin-binding protein, partial [Hyphomonadaceae bacterium]|nr:penicillin-binding protein [Clostridia bacterium]
MQENQGRFIILFVIVFGVCGLFLFRLFDMQLVKGEAYRVMSEKRGMKSIEMKAPRGEIFDRYGRPLVTNRMGFTVQIHKTELPDGEFHQVLFRLLELFEKNQDQYIDTLPISFA